jgi:putative zinc finger protein/fervidolysin-like protein
MQHLDEQGGRMHQRLWELLPWYANGTLAEAEREKVETHLAVCSRCREEEEICRRTAAAVQAVGEVAPSPHPVQLQRMLARIEESESEERSRGGWWRRSLPLQALVEATPRTLRISLVAQAAVILLLVGLLVRQELRSQPAAPPADYVTLSDPAPAPAPSLGVRVMFSPQATEREIRALLHGIRGQIVAGPSPIGVYTVEVPAAGDPLKVILARLRSEPQVAFAEPVAGTETVKETHGR